MIDIFEGIELDMTSVSWIAIELITCVFIASASLILIRYGFLLSECLYLLSVFLVAGISSPGMSAVVLTSGLFILVNGFKLIQHYRRKNIKQVPEDLRELYLQKFKLFSPYEFRKILSFSTEITDAQLIIRKGEKVENLFLLVDGYVEVELDDRVKIIDEHVFLGERTYLKKARLSSVNVRVLKDSRLIVFSFESLQQLEKEIDDFDLRLSFTLAVDLANKLEAYVKSG